MLKRFEVENFQRFKSRLIFDLTSANYDFNQECVNEGLVKTALVYGENASGKSSLVWAIFDIVDHLTDFNKSSLPQSHYLNASSDGLFASFCYVFNFGGKEVVYEYEKSESRKLVRERLSIGGVDVLTYQVGVPFFLSLKGGEGLNKNINAELGLSALKYVYNNTSLDKRSPQVRVFYDFMRFVSGMLMFRALFDSHTYVGLTNGVDNIFRDILRRDNLADFEVFLNEAGIKCKLVKTQSDGEETIGFDFGRKVIPIHLIASTGTKSLALFYYWWQRLRDNDVSFLMIDEFDASYHFKLSCLIFKRLKGIGAQIVLTTHNTSLLSNDIIRPDCGFVINGESIKPLNKMTDKELRNAHNLEKLYRAGAFYVN